MIKPSKITDEELQEIKELQKQYQQLTFQVGELHLIKRNLQEQLKNIDTEIENQYSTGLKLAETEKELIEKLKETYSEANINLETGEIS
jgi:predicted RNase H-like nuclease (RuvC/YqgF family)